jgi:glycosyltransferase involved in cell wall biosynthesis
LRATVPLLVYNGNVKPERGVHFAVEALSLLPGVHLALITNSAGDYLDELMKMASANNLKDRIHIHPYVSNCEVTSFLQGVTAGINPVTVYGNSDLALPNKLFEYIHAGAPVVSSATTAITRFLTKHDCGLSYFAGNVKEFADAVNEVLRKYPNGLLNAGQGSLLAEEYCWEEQEKTIYGMYRQYY